MNSVSPPWTLFRHPQLEEILSLDPAKDFKRIVHLSMAYEMPFAYLMGNMISYIKTFATVDIARVMVLGGETFIDSVKRADDTDIILSTIQEMDFDSEDCQEAFRRFREAHAGLPIKNEYYLYPLSSLILDPIRWARSFGWRPLTRQEELAYFHYWSEAGKRMGIRDIPEDLDELARFNAEWEERHMRTTEDTRRIGVSTDLLKIWAQNTHWTVAPLFLRIFLAFMDDRAIDALGYRRPGPWERRSIHTAIRAVGRVRRFLPALRNPVQRAKSKRLSYPNGFTLSEVGPDMEARRARLAALKGPACPMGGLHP